MPQSKSTGMCGVRFIKVLPSLYCMVVYFQIHEEVFITDDLADELREAFALFDHDNDGYIDPVGFVSTLRSLGYDLTQTDIDDMMRDIGVSQHKTEISFEDFKHFVNKKMRSTDMSDDIKCAFAVLDYNNKSSFTAKELAAIVRQIGERMTDIEAAELIEEANTKEPGIMDRGEFNTLVKRLVANK